MIPATLASLVIYFLSVWRGGGPERAGAAVLLAAFLVDEAYHLATGPVQYRNFDGVELAIDAFSLAAFGWLAVNANRVWPMVVAALQLTSVLGHLSALSEHGMQRAYWAMTEPPVMLSVATLAVGLLLHLLRERRIGPYPDWRSDRQRARR